MRSWTPPLHPSLPSCRQPWGISLALPWVLRDMVRNGEADGRAIPSTQWKAGVGDLSFKRGLKRGLGRARVIAQLQGFALHAADLGETQITWGAGIQSTVILDPLHARHMI